MHSTTMQDDMRDDVWYVDLGASNHMTTRGNWFKELDAMRTPSYVETGDDTVHPIDHIGRVINPVCTSKMRLCVKEARLRRPLPQLGVCLHIERCHLD